MNSQKEEDPSPSKYSSRIAGIAETVQILITLMIPYLVIYSLTLRPLRNILLLHDRFPFFETICLLPPSL
jgi:hypothetical protein